MTNTKPFRESSSAPLDYAWGSGGGSIIATMVSRGVAVSKHTPAGTMRPFGQDTGTADDSSILTNSDPATKSAENRWRWPRCCASADKDAPLNG
jgi:hypothetical protein